MSEENVYLVKRGDMQWIVRKERQILQRQKINTICTTVPLK